MPARALTDPFPYLHKLDRLRSERGTFRFVAAILVLVIGFLIIGLITFTAKTKGLYPLIPMLGSAIGLGLPGYGAYQKYRGKIYPYHDFSRRKWIFKRKPVPIALQLLDETNRRALIGSETYTDAIAWLNETIDTENWILLDREYSVFLFRYEKDAMLFKLRS